MLKRSRKFASPRKWYN